ncbi:serine protease [Bradyrhizobium sp. CSA112]|uniref:S1 family peptidase n=1 Tax=Bradyrhizobium sp. CSA112 TaxID=2699170 RepID=UPI0023B1A029|nr:serine protease [Bradyrhizobium sp. CSA112]
MAQSWVPVRAPENTATRSLARPPEPATIPREKSGTAFFVDDAGHMLTARHAVEDCTRLFVAKEGRIVLARTVALSPGFDLALIKVPKTMGLAAVFPRGGAAAVNDMMFAAAYDTLPGMTTRGGTLANARVTPSYGGSEAGHLVLDSTVTFGASGAPVLDSRGLVEGVISRRTRIDRVLAVGAGEAKAFLTSNGVRFDQDDRPQMAGGGSRANRAASISARVTCLQN